MKPAPKPESVRVRFGCTHRCKIAPAPSGQKPTGDPKPKPELPSLNKTEGLALLIKKIMQATVVECPKSTVQYGIKTSSLEKLKRKKRTWFVGK
jgi:hypothetical protein